MNLAGKKVDLGLLQTQLAAAGIVVPALGTYGDELHSYDAGGMVVDVPAGAAAVVAAHNAADAPGTVLRAAIIAAAQSAAGVQLNALTQAQRNALLAAMLWKLGGVAPDTTVRPLAEWT